MDFNKAGMFWVSILPIDLWVILSFGIFIVIFLSILSLRVGRT